MKKNYNLIYLFVLAAFIIFAAGANAQEIGGVQWEDHFDDAEQDYLLNNVGWMYFGLDDGLDGQVTMQTEDQKASIKSGIFSSFIGAGLIQTNGVGYINLDDQDDTETRAVAQSELNSPNHVISFEINFKKMSIVPDGASPMGTFFICGARFNAAGKATPNVQEDSSYVLMIAPLANITAIAKFSGELAALDPTQWVWLTPQSMDFEYDLGVPYQVKFWLHEGDLKVKVWEGDPSDEPDEWLLETVDPEPWVVGKWHMFALLGDPLPDGDEMILDDVVVNYFAGDEPSAVESDVSSTPVEFALADNYPNPFNPQTTIEYSLDNAGAVAVNVYSVTGRLVQTLVDAYQAAGRHSVVFNGVDNSGNSIPSGIYFYTMTNGSQTITKKMILTK